MRRLTLGALVVAATATGLARPAFAGAFDSGVDNPAVGSVAVTASDTGSDPPDQASATASVPSPCDYTWIAGTDLPGPDGSTSGTWGYPSGTNPPGCRNALPAGFYGPPTAFWVAATAGALAPAPQQVAITALSSAQLIDPTFQTWPPDGHAEVNWPTWIHVSSGWAPISTSATAGPVTATVTATPTSMTVSSFDSSDGGSTYRRISVTCPGPGTAYNPNQPYSGQHSDCTITWAWPSANYGSGRSYGMYPLTVSVTYSVSWAATGGPGGGGTLAPITRSTTVDFRVGEVEALGS